MITNSARDRSASRSTGIVFACAFCALVVSVLVVQRSTAALSIDADSHGAVTAGELELSDDDKGRSLLDIDALAPGRPIESCINVTYTGTVLPADIAFVVEASGELAPYLEIVVERGTGAAFGDCAGFVPDMTIATGALDQLAGVSHPAASTNDTPFASGFRITTSLRDDGRAQGTSVDVEFVWEATPG